MPILTGYAVNSFDVLSGATDLTTIGGRFRVAPAFDADTDAIFVDISDDDGAIAGDASQNEVGDDSNQTATIRDASGNVLSSGRIYIEGFRTLTAPDGTTVQLYQLEIGGTHVGWLAQPELQPGVTYEIESSGNVDDNNAPQYSSFTDTIDYDPDGANTIQGGDLDDSLVGGSGDDVIAGEAGNDTLDGGAGSDFFNITDNHETDTIIGGEAGTDYDQIAFSNFLSTQGVTVTFSGGEAGTYDFDGTAGSGIFSEIEAIYGTAYADFVDASLSTANQTLVGNQGDDKLLAGDGDDYISGGAGANTLSGGAGTDVVDNSGSAGAGRLQGGEGTDSLIAGDGGDVILGDGLWTNTDDFQSIAGGTATNLTVTNSANGPIKLWLIESDGSLTEYATIAAGDTHVQATTDTENWILRDENDYFLKVIEGAPNQSVDYGATALDDTIVGGAGDDVIYTQFGDATVTGGAGNDYIDDVWGSKTGGHRDIDAGSGDDTVYAGDGTSSIQGGTGTDEIYAEGGADTVDGGDGTDLIHGEDGDDILRGGAGGDTIFGGAGADTIYGSTDPAGSVQDIGGTDTQSENWPVIRLGNAADVDPDETDDDSENASALLGNYGGPGAELYKQILDASGNDADGDGIIDDNDSGNGPETITIGGINKFLDSAQFYNATVTFTDGTTGTFSAVVIQTTDGDFYLAPEMSGNADNALLTSKPIESVSLDSVNNPTVFLNDDRVDANYKIESDGTADDSLSGGDDADLFVVEDGFGSDTIVGGEGITTGIDYDTIDLSAVTVPVTVTFSGTGAGSITDGTSTLTFSEIEKLVLTQYADFADLTGDTGGIEVIAGDGDDTVTGGSGNDTISGGAGSDLIDGGDGDDFLTTGIGNDTLLGGAGNDTLMNSDGDDSLVGGAGDDSIIATGGNDTLEGGDGNDTLDGGADNDSLEGGAGDDSLTGGTGNDTFVFNPGDGADTITDFNAGNTGALGDGDQTNNDFIDLSAYYDSIFELRRDFADDGVLNQSTGDDFSDNTQFAPGDSLTFQGASQSSFQSDNTGVICFASGTRITTIRGEVPVERLRPGDLILTRDNGPQPLLWSAMRQLGPAELAAAPHLRPVEIAAGAFGNARPLVVSPQHGVLLTLDGAQTLVRAIHLARLDGGSVRQRRGCRHVTYWHLFFESHQIVFSNGVASESFFPGPQALRSLAPGARRELTQLLPEIARIDRISAARRTYGAPAREYSRTRTLPDHARAFRAPQGA